MLKNSQGLNRYVTYLLPIVVCLVIEATALGQGSAFTYQGRLTDSGNPADGLFNMQFKLFDSQDFITGTQVGSTITIPTVQVMNGSFSVQLDFASCPTCFNGSPRFLEVGVKPAGSPGAFTVLNPRQPIAASPYAVRSLSAATADNATQLGGQPASGFIQNTTSQQAGTNFNISGDGSVGGTLSGNIISAGSHYRISGVKVLGISGPYNNAGIVLQGSNTFAGENAGMSVTPNPDLSILSGKLNSFFGADAGRATTFGTFNSFFGALAGRANTTGLTNSFFGASAGESNTTGQQNSFFGFQAGDANTTGQANSFFGTSACQNNTTGSLNVAVGFAAGFDNTTGIRNIFIGRSAGRTNTTGSDNIAIGPSTNFGANNLTNAVAIGTRAQVNQSNSLVLGSINGVNDCTPANVCDSVNVGIGTTAPQHRLDVNGGINTSTQYNLAGLRMLAATGPFDSGVSVPLATSNTFVGERAGPNTAPNPTPTSGEGKNNSFFGAKAGEDNTTGSGNSFFGVLAGAQNTTGIGNSFFGVQAGVGNNTGSSNTMIGILANTGANNLTNATAIGARARVDQSNSLVLGGITGVNSGTSVNVGIGTTTPSDRLHVVGDIRVGTGTTGCVKDADGTVIAGTCSSDARLKQQVTPFPETLDKLIQLRPVHFYWRADEYKDRAFGGSQSFGLIAQEVERVMPELVAEDRQGYKAVNYSKLPLLMLQAIKELKAENDSLKQKLEQLSSQQQLLKQQQIQIENLKKILCLDHPQTKVCK